MFIWTLCPLLLIVVDAQIDQLFSLPNAQRNSNRPTVPPDLEGYFDLGGHARQFVDSLIGPRPGGLFPPKNFEIGTSSHRQGAGTDKGFFDNSGQPNFKLPPGFHQGFSLINTGGKRVAFSRDPQPGDDDTIEGSGVTEFKSSIDGIPNVFPHLPKAPIAQSGDNSAPTMIASSIPDIPQLQARPEVPEGGLAPTDNIRRAPQSSSGDGFNDNLPLPKPVPANADYGGLSGTPPRTQGGLIGSVLQLLGLNGARQPTPTSGAVGNFIPTDQSVDTVGTDNSVLGSAISGLLNGKRTNDQQRQPTSMLSNVLYNALTSGTVQKSNDTDGNTTVGNTSLALSPAQQAAIGENIQLIQQLITQPSSPLCNPKPQPVADFRVDAFMGQWYQVLYSPPLSAGPCSMVAYKKLADIASGGPGTVFDTFEYTTEGTPFGRPRISSGYAIIRAPGELIYRTTSNQNDVNVHVIDVGPTNAAGEYEYAVLSVNCNYPLHVFARDPIVYKQRYEPGVNLLLEQRGLINGFSRLLNIVAPVDSTLCTFPPTLFNIQG